MTGERRTAERRTRERRREAKPWFSLWVDDFLGSETVSVCSNRALGCYVKLMCYQWKHKGLPTDLRKLAAICRENPHTFSKLWPEISEKFPEKDGRFVNPRMEVERRHANSLSKTRSQSGSKRAAKAEQLPSNSGGLSQPQSLSQSQPEETPKPTRSTALVAPSATKLSVPAIVEQLQDVALQARRRETAGARREMFVDIVFAYWATKLNHEGTLLDNKRRATLRARFVENGDNLSELLYVVDGALRDDWTMGRDARSTKRYDQIATIYQDREHVEKFAAMNAAWKAGTPHPMADKYGKAA